MRSTERGTPALIITLTWAVDFGVYTTVVAYAYVALYFWRFFVVWDQHQAWLRGSIVIDNLPSLLWPGLG